MGHRVVSNAINAAHHLGQRLSCNRASDGSFGGFVQGLLAVDGDDCVLDLGAGLGAQLLDVAEKARYVVGVDVSPENVATLRGRLARENAQVVVGDMDELHELGLRGPFTLAYSVYSIYYSRNPARLLESVAGVLSGTSSRCVVVTPDLGNNEGWYASLSRLYPLPEAVLAVAGMCRGTVLPAFNELFASVRCATFSNEVQFNSLDRLMSYYDACAPYCLPEYRDEACALFGREFARNGSYTITKKAIGIVGKLAHGP
jgi:SAM-dependent methyltransferase